MPVPFGGYAEDDAPPPEKKKFGWGDTWPARMAKDLIEAVKLPGDVAAGRVDPLSDEAIGRSADLAGVVSGGMGKQLGVPARQIKQTGMGKWFGAPQEGPMPSGRAPGLLREQGITMPGEGPAPEVRTPAGKAHMAEYGEQAARQTREAASEITRSFDPQGVERSPEQAGAVISESMQRAAELRQQSIDGAVKRAVGPDQGGKQAAVNAAAFTVVPQNIVADLTNARIMLIAEGPSKTTYANAMMEDMTREVARLSTGNKGGPAAGAYGNVNLAEIDKMTLKLETYQRAAMDAGRNAIPGSAKDLDIKATQAIAEAFSNHIDQIINSKAYVGDTSKVKAWNVARERKTLFSDKFGGNVRKPVNEVIQKIIGENKYDPAAAARVGDHLWGGIGVLPDHYNVAVAKRARSMLGADSQGWAAAQQQLWRKAVDIGKPDDWQPRMIKDRILDLLDGSGKAVANEVYSPQKRAIMRNLANIQGTLDLAINSTGISSQTAAKATGAMLAQLESGLGKFARDLHRGFTVAQARIAEKKELNDLQQKFPIIRKATEKWWNDVQRAQRSNVGLPGRQRADVFRATTTYALELRKAGIGSVPTVTVPRRADQGGTDKLSADRAFGGPAM